VQNPEKCPIFMATRRGDGDGTPKTGDILINTKKGRKESNPFAMTLTGGIPNEQNWVKTKNEKKKKIIQRFMGPNHAGENV